MRFFFKIALLVVISRTWTSLAGVLKLPRVSNAFKDYTRLHIVKPLNEELKLQILYYVVQTNNSSHCKLRACQRLYRWFWKFFNVFSENPFFALLATQEQIVPTEQSRQYEILFMKKFENVVNSIICFAKEGTASIALIIEWAQFVLQNC